MQNASEMETECFENPSSCVDNVSIGMELDDIALLSALGAVAVDSDILTKQVLADVQKRLDEEDAKKINPLSSKTDCHASVVTPSTTDTFGNNALLPSSASTSILQSLLIDNQVSSLKGKCHKGEVVPNPEDQRTKDTAKRVKHGEMTPFGTSLEAETVQHEPTSGSILLGTYLQNQLQLQKQFKKEQHQQKTQRKRKRLVSEDLTTSDDDLEPKSSSSKISAKDPLRANILFPKPRPKKTKLGTKSTRNKALYGKSPGFVPSEEASMYLNETEDSDYAPESHSASDLEDLGHDRQKKKERQKLVRKRKQSTSYASSEYSDHEERPKRSKKVGEYTDDGNLKVYQDRVQQWKNTETRFTSEVHKMDGGFTLPKYIWELLFKYQQVGVKWLWELHQQRSGGILSDEMGLGKTIQVICFLAGVSCSNMLFRFSEFRGVGPSLIVCPATVMNQWVQEFHKWWPPFRIGLLHESGTYTGRKDSFIRSMHESRGFVVTTYKGIVQNQDELLKYSWDYVILDEGHKIRNPDAQVTIALKRIPTPRRLILSGSPLQNNLKELWSLFDFVTPGRLGTLPAFLEKFAVPITQGGYSSASDLQVATAYKCATTLRDIINPYLLRRMKSDVSGHLKLPGKNEQVLFCKVTEEQKTLYKTYLKSDQIRNVVNGGEHRLFVGLINLRKICNHPHLFGGIPPKSESNLVKKTILEKRAEKRLGGVFEEDEGEDIEVNEKAEFGHWRLSGKMIVVQTLLSVWKQQDQKVLLFTQSRQMLCILEKFLQQENYTYLRLDGCTPIGSRQTVIDKFNKDSSIFVFLLTTRVGGLGVNLTGANRVVIFDPDWNPSTDLQARERAWRIGQGREVTIYRLITSGTIEEKIYHRQIFKQFLTNRILKDPRQKRFFKQNQLLELFSFNDGSSNETETEVIFEGTDSKVARPRKRRRSTLTSTSTIQQNLEEEEPRENSKGKFRGVPNLVKQKVYSETGQEATEDGLPGTERKTNVLSQDEYVLRKLFKKSVVNVALKHDRIVDAEQPDIAIIEKEAELVAKDAIRVLKKSREQCWDASTGKVTWTGTHGTLRKVKKPATEVLKSSTDSKKTEVLDEKASFFSTPVLTDSNKAPTTPAELLAIIKARKRRNLMATASKPPNPENEEEGVAATAVEPGDVESSKMELLSDIRSFVAFRGTTNGEATTTELVEEFGSKLPPGDSVLFKQMLNQLCTSRQVQGRRIWRLKPEFR